LLLPVAVSLHCQHLVSAIQARDHLGLYRASNVAIASRSPPPSPPTGFARGRFFTSKDRPHCHRKLEHARILKNGAATIGVCSAPGRPWDTDRPSWPRAVEGAGMAQRGRRLKKSALPQFDMKGISAVVLGREVWIDLWSRSRPVLIRK
jgi:hypothetical protein